MEYKIQKEEQTTNYLREFYNKLLLIGYEDKEKKLNEGNIYSNEKYNKLFQSLCKSTNINNILSNSEINILENIKGIGAIYDNQDIIDLEECILMDEIQNLEDEIKEIDTSLKEEQYLYVFIIYNKYRYWKKMKTQS